MSRYRIEALLTHARRGPVYYAVDEESERPVCFRTFAKDSRVQEGGVPDHLHIAPLYETGVLKGRPYAATELLQGRTLAHIGGEASSVLPVLLKAVGIAHRHGLIHGHLRAHNVVMVEGRGPVITDYGLPVALADLDSYRDLLAYLAPEQFPHVRAMGFSTDIYGVGLIGYTLLAGKLPFDPSMDPRRIVSDVTMVEPKRPPGPDALVDMVMRMLSKSPTARPTAEEALDSIVPKLS